MADGEAVLDCHEKPRQMGMPFDEVVNELVEILTT
jgi:hypothetical protein